MRYLGAAVHRGCAILLLLVGLSQGASALTLESDDALVIAHDIILPVGSRGQDGEDIVLRAPVVTIRGAVIKAGDGGPGADASGIGSVTGGAGGRGGDIIVKADVILLEDALLRPGDGGTGGHAFARGDPHAVATGGHGGRAGLVSLNAILRGSYRTIGAKGGDGGNASATGLQGCDGRDAREANVTRSTLDEDRNANATPEPAGCGPPDGVGGAGGNAHAFGGDGGPSVSGDGGDGGWALVFPGHGGDGKPVCLPNAALAAATGYQRAGSGGPSGNYLGIGGDGGPGVLRGGDAGGAYAAVTMSIPGNATRPIEPGRPWTTFRDSDEPLFVTGGKGGSPSGRGGDARVDFLDRGWGGTQCGGELDRPLPWGLDVSLAAVLVGAVLYRARRRR